ncbi:hypothetical protein LCGC14_2432170 [marine sediment metagenome]|uniref:Uncharacterized protein n=1 Tax=marine sediment metagenome TaxID=412755 RepID=A0A0F9DYL1_9ZZZZ
MAIETFTLTVDAAGNPEAVVVPTSCKSVEVREQGDPTTDYFVRAPGIANAQHRRFAGSATIFRAIGRMFQPGEIVGYLETVAGSVPFSGITDAEAGEA